MIHKKITQFICSFCVIACLASLFGCSKEELNNPIVTYPKDLSAIADFKCICSIDHETDFVIESDDAKALYTYINEQLEKAETSDTLAVSDEHFYGVFWIHENDYMVYTAMPMTSFQIYYKMPAGTYDKIAKLVNK